MEEKVIAINEGEDAILIKEKTTEGLDVVQKIPKILVEILLYATEDETKKMNNALAELQSQLNSSRKAKNRVRVFWTIDKGETTAEQKKQWLIERSNCVYYVFAPENHVIPSNYIKSILENVKKFEESVKVFKKYGVKIFKPTTTNEPRKEE
jgi:activator of 2-hydroxyglutaryl-CoA dehydratase